MPRGNRAGANLRARPGDRQANFSRMVQSGLIAPLTPSKAPGESSAISSRAGSTGPVMVTWPLGMGLKPALP